MKHALRLSFVVCISALATAACGGGSTSSDTPAQADDPDEAAIREEADHPDATFDAVSAKAALEARRYAGPAVSLTVPTTSDYCPALTHAPSGSCPCPSGGSFDFTSATDEGADEGDTVVRTQLHACAVSGFVLDGHEYFHGHTGATSPGHEEIYRVAAVDVTVTDASGTHPLSLRAVATPRAVAGDDLRFSLKVADGWLTLTFGGPNFAADDGHGTFACDQERDGSYYCRSSNGRPPVVAIYP